MKRDSQFKLSYFLSANEVDRLVASTEQKN